jgi:large subunit ribosomal protein L6
MSRVGKQPIKVPSGVSVALNNAILEVKGPKGILTRDTFGRIQISQQNDEILVSTSLDTKGAYWGLYRTLIANMVHGVSNGFTECLEIQGTGYRAAVTGEELVLTVGYSHPVKLKPYKGIRFEVDKAGDVHVHGIDKELVTQTASKICAVRPAEPYHGKGIRYKGQVIKTKPGKSAASKK